MERYRLLKEHNLKIWLRLSQVSLTQHKIEPAYLIDKRTYTPDGKNHENLLRTWNLLSHGDVSEDPDTEACYIGIYLYLGCTNILDFLLLLSVCMQGKLGI